MTALVEDRTHSREQAARYAGDERDLLERRPAARRQEPALVQQRPLEELEVRPTDVGDRLEDLDERIAHTSDAALVREFIEATRRRVVVAWPRTGEYTRKRVEALRPETLPAVRETFALYAEEYDAIRDRTLDGVDARVALLRAAEAAQRGQVQEAVDAVVSEYRLLSATCQCLE